MTVAERLAEQSGNSGLVITPETASRFEAEAVRTSRQFDSTRYTFADDSVITVVNGAWDLGYADCYCWQGAGHTDECPEKPSNRIGAIRAEWDGDVTIEQAIEHLYNTPEGSAEVTERGSVHTGNAWLSDADLSELPERLRGIGYRV